MLIEPNKLVIPAYNCHNAGLPVIFILIGLHCGLNRLVVHGVCTCICLLLQCLIYKYISSQCSMSFDRMTPYKW